MVAPVPPSPLRARWSFPRVLHREHRTGGQPHDLLGDAAEDDMFQTGAAMGRHHDEIGMTLPGKADDCFGGAPDSDRDVPRAAEGLRYEVAQFRQRLFTDVTAHDRRL